MEAPALEEVRRRMEFFQESVNVVVCCCGGGRKEGRKQKVDQNQRSRFKSGKIEKELRQLWLVVCELFKCEITDVPSLFHPISRQRGAHNQGTYHAKEEGTYPGQQDAKLPWEKHQKNHPETAISY